MDTDKTPYRSAPPRERDLAAVGFDSFLEYRLWCLRNGYTDGLRGSQPEPWRTARSPRNGGAPHDTEERRAAIRKTIAGDTERSEAYDCLDRNPEAQAALLRMMLHANRYLDVLRLKLLAPEVGRHRELSYGLVALALHHDKWMRPVESWTSPLPRGGHPRRDV